MSEKNIVLIGNFDGVHVGHQSLIALGQKLLKSEGGNFVKKVATNYLLSNFTNINSCYIKNVIVTIC